MAPAILFIDEIETVAPTRSSNLSDALTRDLTNELLQQMDRVQLASSPMIVVAASTRPDQIDPAILNRFMKIAIPLPDEAARRAMLKQLIRGCGWPLDPALDVDEVSAMLAKQTQQMSGRDLKLLVAPCYRW
jgi:transitional endoplasmic reticulum ATPase